MLKKILILVFFILLLFNVCFAVEIPKDKQAKYKAEIETYISKESPAIKKRVDLEFWHAKNMHNLYEIYKYTIDKKKYTNGLSEHLLNIDSEEFYLYLHLIDITDKYVKIKKDMPVTDYAGYLYDFIYPYLKNNNIDIKGINNIILYIDDKRTKIEGFINEVN